VKQGWYYLARRSHTRSVVDFGDLAIDWDGGVARVAGSESSGCYVPTANLGDVVVVWIGSGHPSPLPEASWATGSLVYDEDMTIEAPVTDVLENVVDIHHFEPMHATTIVSNSLRIEATPNCLSVLKERVEPSMAGARSIPISAHMYGPGLLVENHVHPRFPMTFLGIMREDRSGRTIQAGQMWAHFSTESAVSKRWVSRLQTALQRELARDALVWRHKRRGHRPCLVPEDHGILRFRGWLEQLADA